MADAAELSPNLEQLPNQIQVTERALTEVDHLINHHNNGTFDQFALPDILQNLTTAVQEAAMPYAVTTTKHEVAINKETGNRTFMWLGKTAVEAAMSGYKYHIHEAARARVDVEVDEARHASEALSPDVMKVFISPRMTREDATLTEARREHLGDEDSVRVSWLETDQEGEVKNRVMQSLLVRDIPIQAWIALLRDPNNPFGKSVEISDEASALSIMKAHRELEVSMDVFPEGPVSVVEAVVPYITDPKMRQGVMEQLELFRGDQEKMQQIAQQKAQQWLEFEMALSESLINRVANFDIKRFIIGLQEFWTDDDLAVIRRHELSGADYEMSRELAVIVENAKRNTLWGGSALSVNNRHVTKQVSSAVATRIQQNEALIHMARQNGIDYHALEMENIQLIASQNMKVGGGCPGKIENTFGSKNRNPGELETLYSEQSNDDNVSDSPEKWKWKHGTCRVKACGKKTEVGPCNVCRTCQAKFDKGDDPENQKVANETTDRKDESGESLVLGLEDAEHRVDSTNDLELEHQQLLAEEKSKELQTVGNAVLVAA